jgi:vitamin B12 transporter
MAASSRRRDRASGAITLALSAFAAAAASAQEAAPPDNSITVTANRSPTALSRAGSAVTIITGEEIQKLGTRNVLDVLRGVPGVDVYDRGGVGSNATVGVRGSNPGQTLILVDGVRVGNTTSTDGSFDFGSFGVTDIERIEVLRGPQSALYGSDAMGGVINIITRKGTGKPTATVQVEGGSYGTKGTQASVSGATGPLNFALSMNALDTNGFSRYGYRIGRITATLPGKLEADETQKLSGTGRFGLKLNDNAQVEAGFSSYYNFIHFDDTTADNALNKGRTYVNNLWSRGIWTSDDGGFRSSVLIYQNRTDQLNNLYAPQFGPPDYASYDFRGIRTGAEWQNDIRIGQLGSLILGARTETETGTARSGSVPRFSGARSTSLDASQSTNSAFALWQVPVGERLSLSFGGRADDVLGVDTFYTWRTTAAYNIWETGTKLRASAGTGAKAPSLYQQAYAVPSVGPNGLQPEHNVGVDAGVDQSLWGGRITLSGTVFWSKYRDLIAYRDLPDGTYGYYNVASAEISGLEASAEFHIVPGEWKARATYTFMIAQDLETNQELLQRPRNKGSLGLVYTGIPHLELEGRVVLVGARWDYAGFDFVTNTAVRTQLAPYAKLDAYARYAFNDTWSAFVKAENLTNAHYQDAYNYGVAGRSVYVGVRATW